MTLKLIRIRRTEDYVEGIIQSEGLTRCHTAENARYGLAEGTYDVTMRYCKMRGCSVLFVAPSGEVPQCAQCKEKKGYSAALNLGLVDGCECPMPVRCPQIAVGNGVRLRTDGSIIVGTAVCPGVVKLSERSYKSLYASVKRGMSLGFNYQLEVVEENWDGSPIRSARQIGEPSRFPHASVKRGMRLGFKYQLEVREYGKD